MHRSTAIRAVNALAERGWITVEKSTRRGMSNHYRIAFGLEPEERSTENDAAASEATN